jgi:hypothetical protein
MFDVLLVWLDHVVPPFVVFKIVPLLPTAHAVLVSIATTSQRWFDVLLVWNAQFVPPSVVLRIFPLLATTHTVFASAAATSLRISVVPLVCAAQVLPPSVVLMMPPFDATAHAVLVLSALIAVSSATVPLTWLAHELPPFVVFDTVPVRPTIHAVFTSMASTLLSCVLGAPEMADHVVPPSVVRRTVPLSPTAQQVVVLTQSIPRIVFVVPLVWLVHVPRLAGASAMSETIVTATSTACAVAPSVGPPPENVGAAARVDVGRSPLRLNANTATTRVIANPPAIYGRWWGLRSRFGALERIPNVCSIANIRRGWKMLDGVQHS